MDASPLDASEKTAHEPVETIAEEVKETIQHVSETVIEAVVEEVHEAFTPEKTATEKIKSEEIIQSQHHFIDEITQDAKEEIEAAHAHLDTATKTLEPIVEETHDTVTQMPEAAEAIIAEEDVKAQHHVIDEIAHDAKTDVTTAQTEQSTTTKALPEEVVVDSLQATEEPQKTVSETATQAIDSAEETIDKKPAITEAITPEITPEPLPAEIVETTTEVAIEDHATPDTTIASATNTPIENEEPQEKPQKKAGFFARLSNKLSKTRNNLTEGIADLFLGKKEINEDILEELETRLLMADVGINVTNQMLTSIRDSVSRKSLSNVDELFAALKVQMKDILEPVSKPLVIDREHKPYVILMIGVNGVGKTTTIGKLAKKFQSEGKSVMLAAGDTFRAAAVEQLEIWGERNKIPVISQKEGADPASIIFDAMESAKSRKVDILIADTAGRLHTDSGLMQELAKINRVMKRHDETAPHEVMLVVDASTGQNALNQARQFNATIPLSGITFTKLDGTAKGGIIFAIAEELKIPIRFIGVGESIDDLRPFNSDEFVDALISMEKAD